MAVTKINRAFFDINRCAAEPRQWPCVDTVVCLLNAQYRPPNTDSHRFSERYFRFSGERRLREAVMGKSRATRLREQRARQQAYRDEQKRQRRPGRDDIARVALRWLILGTAKLAVREGNPARMNKVENDILEALVEQGFDRAASDRALGELIDRYVEGQWDFRRKVHLLTGPDGRN